MELKTDLSDFGKSLTKIAFVACSFDLARVLKKRVDRHVTKNRDRNANGPIGKVVVSAVATIPPPA